MSTILGPLVNGLRIQFKVDFDLADTANLSDIIIKDTLPDGISWYQNTPNNNKLTYTLAADPTNVITLTPVTDFTVNAVSPDVIFTLTPVGIAKLTGAGTLAAYIDTIISDAALIDPAVGATNTASAEYKQNNILNQGEVNEVINLEGSAIKYISPDYAPKDQNQQIPITLGFTAGSSTDPTLNYIVTADLGTNLVLDSTVTPANEQITATYQDELGNDIPVTLTFTNAGSVYTITIPNNADIAGKNITLVMKTKPQYSTTPPQTIPFKYKLTLGQANADFMTKEIIVSGTFTLRKSVITI